MVKRLKEEGHSADAIHGDLRQSKRDRVITSFRKGLKRILIATDVAARGLDIPLIQHVINYDLPQVPEDYVHRIGRTARAGTEGSALTFLTPDDRSMWNEISKLIDPNFKPAPRGTRGNSRSGIKRKAPYNKKRKFRDEKKSFSKGRSSSSSRDGEKKVLVTKENLVLVINQNHLAMEDQAHHQEMERKKVLVTKENLVLVINQNYLAMEDQAHHQEMERKKSFGYKGKSSFGDKSKLSGYGRSSSSSRDGEKKSFGYKRKSSFGDKSKPSGFTNNPKYFGKKAHEGSPIEVKKKDSSFIKKKKFKSRSDRPKSFTFKKHSQKSPSLYMIKHNNFFTRVLNNLYNYYFKKFNNINIDITDG